MFSLGVWVGKENYFIRLCSCYTELVVICIIASIIHYNLYNSLFARTFLGYVIFVGKLHIPKSEGIRKDLLCLVKTPFCFKDDVVMGTLTVRENLQFSAALRLPTTMTNHEKNERINMVIQELGLDKVADSKVMWKTCHSQRIGLTCVGSITCSEVFYNMYSKESLLSVTMRKVTTYLI